MIKGITSKEEEIIKNILKKYPYDFYYYGSRVKGDFQKSSDLDILLKTSDDISFNIINSIELEFNNSPIPYIVNISNYKTMDKNFYNLIKNDLIKIF